MLKGTFCRENASCLEEFVEETDLTAARVTIDRRSTRMKFGYRKNRITRPATLGGATCLMRGDGG